MKKTFLFGVFGLFFLGSVLAYVPTTQETALVRSLIPMIQELDEKQFDAVYEMVRKAKSAYDLETRKGWVAEVLLDSLEVEVQKREMAKNDAAIPSISSEDMATLFNHIPMEQLLGNDILLLEFTDLECPFCKRFHEAGTLDEVVRTYDGVGSVSFAFPLSFHKNAEYAAHVTQCFWREYGYDAAKTFKTELFSAGFSSKMDIDEVLYASEVENTDVISSCLINGDAEPGVQQQSELGKVFGVRGTPSTIVLHLPTGRYAKISGAQSTAAFSPSIDAMQTGERSFFHVATSPTPGAGGAASVDKKAYQAFLETAVITGDPDAPVTIIEFSDVQCPFCQRHEDNGTIGKVQEKYGDQVNTIFGHFPLSFHANAQDAAEAIECAGQQGGDAGYLAFKKAYFAQGGDASLEKANIAATEVGLDGDALLACVESNVFEQLVKDQMAFGKSLGVTGTPGNVVIDNEKLTVVKVSGAVPASAFDSVIGSILE